MRQNIFLRELVSKKEKTYSEISTHLVLKSKLNINICLFVQDNFVFKIYRLFIFFLIMN